MPDHPRIALIGPGAIGTTITSMLHEVGRTPLLCGRSAHPRLLLRYDDVDIVGWLSALCNENTVICVLQNGIE